MFCFAKSYSTNVSNFAVLLDYCDPSQDPTPFAPPMIQLRASMNSFKNLGVVPEMQLVYTIAESSKTKLAVLNGGIRFDGDKFLFQNGEGLYELDFEGCVSFNHVLASRVKLKGVPTEYPHLQPPGSTPPVAWTSNIASDIFVPENFALDWVGSLILVHYNTTRATLHLLQTRTKIPKMVYDRQSDGNLFWVWWPGPKPSSIRDWLADLFYWKDPPMETVSIIRRILPTHTGFYRAKLGTRGGRPGLYLDDSSTVFYEIDDGEGDLEHYFVRRKGHHPIVVLEESVSNCAVANRLEIQMISTPTRMFILPSNFPVSEIGGIVRSDVGSTESLEWSKREYDVSTRKLQELHSAAYENARGLLKLVKD